MVSIIIPIYNAESYIADTINSVINQSFQEWELILVDDGSTDQSSKIINEIAKNEQRISIILQKNAGVSIARNTGIKKAKGNYIFFLDSDDLWLPENITNRLKVFEKNKTIDWIFGSVQLIDENSKKINSIIKGSDSNILNSLLLWSGAIITTPSTICVRKECLNNIKFDKNLSTAADQDFAIQLASKYNGNYFETPNVLYRVVPNSMSKNFAVMEKDHIRVFKKVAKNGLYKNYWFKQQCFSNLYWILGGTWWKDGDNKLKGIKYFFLALLNNPFSIFKLINKSGVTNPSI